MSKPKVLIIGAGLTGISLGYYLNKAKIDFTIIEKQNRIGGVINSNTEKGFTYEAGPNTGVLGNIEIEALFKDLKGSCKLELASEEAKQRLIWKNNKAHALPSGPISAITTPLFTFTDKIKVLIEPLKKAGTNPHENLRDFVERRLGKSFHDYAIAPFINGIYAGNTEQIIPKYALPKLYNLEQEYGSLIKGAIKKKKDNKRNNIAIPSKAIFSCKGGLETFIHAMANNFKVAIKLNCDDVQIKKQGALYNANWTQESINYSQEFDYVVSTLPAYKIETCFPFFAEKNLNVFKNIEYAPITHVSLGFNKWTGPSLNAFGLLIPPIEKRDILGVLYTSSMFADKAPKDGALLSVFMGGMLNKHIAQLGDKELLEVIKKEFAILYNITDFTPDLIKIKRYKNAIPQYTIHSELVIETIANIEKDNPNLILAGGISKGIAMADRVKQAFEIATKITSNNHC